MAAATRKAQIQVTTPNMAAVPRLLCNLIVSQWRLDVLKKRALPLSFSLLPQCISLACYGCSTCDSSGTGGGEPVNPPTCWQTDRQKKKKKKPQTEQIPGDRGEPGCSPAQPGGTRRPGCFDLHHLSAQLWSRRNFKIFPLKLSPSSPCEPDCL